MIEELEKIVIEKSYFELSTQDKIDLQEWISSEDEFNHMKMMFSGLSMQKTEMTDIIPSATLKNRLAAEFNTTYSKKRLVWYNKLGLFLWPAEKPWHKRPAFQIVTVGCLLAVIITVVPTLSPNKGQFTAELVSNEKENQKINEAISGQKKISTELPIVEENKSEELILTDDLGQILNESTDKNSIELKEINDSEDLINKEPTIASNTTSSGFSDASFKYKDISPSAANSDEIAETEEKMNVNNDQYFDLMNDSDVPLEDREQKAAKPSSIARAIHPDGIYVGDVKADKNLANTASLSEQVGMLDLLTAAY